MAVKLYVGHISMHVTQSQIENLFSEVGRVTETYLAINRYTGKSNGFAFVDLESETVAHQAVTRFHGYVLDGMPLTVHRMVNSEKGTIKKPKLPEVPETTELVATVAEQSET